MFGAAVGALSRTSLRSQPKSFVISAKRVSEPGEAAERSPGAGIASAAKPVGAGHGANALTAAGRWASLLVPDQSHAVQVSDPNDAAERQAARVADTVVRSLSAAPEAEAAEKTPVGSGCGLDEASRRRFEPYFGDLSAVRIHKDATAAEAADNLNAHAFTIGTDISFAAGKFAPESSEGQRLLAHELEHATNPTHDSAVAHRDVTGADAAVAAAPAVSAPVGIRTGRPIADLEREFRDLIAAARSKGYPVAADNLEHFLTGGGATRSVPLSWLRSFSVVTDAEKRNQRADGRFEDELKDKALKLGAGGSTTFSDYWDSRISASPLTELYYASGVSQLRSTGSFSLSRAADTVTIIGTVNQRWFDPYNWNPGMGAWIPGHGQVSDDVGLDLKDAGRGRDYLLENLYSQTLVGSYIIRPWYRPNSSTFTWSGP